MGAIGVIPGTNDIAAIVDGERKGVDSSWICKGGESTFAPEEADERAIGVVLYLVIADDIAGIIDAGGRGGEGTGVVEQSEFAAIEEESVNDSDGLIGEGADDDSLIVDAGRGDAEGIGQIDVGDFAAAQEVAVGVEVVVVPVAYDLAFVVDAIGKGELGAGNVEGCDVLGVRGGFGRGAVMLEKGSREDGPLGVISRARRNAESGKGRQRQQRNS